MALAWLYLFCNIGDEITTRFRNVGDTLYRGPWHKLPLNLRRNIPEMILMIAQKPIHIQGFGNLRCTRETYKSVLAYNCICLRFVAVFNPLNSFSSTCRSSRLDFHTLLSSIGRWNYKWEFINYIEALRVVQSMFESIYFCIIWCICFWSIIMFIIHM